MWWTMVEDYPLPKSIGGHPALELCNTRAAWGRPLDREGEWLRDYDRFAVWARHHGLIDADAAQRLRGEAAAHPRSAARVLADMRRLRDAVYRAVTEAGDHAGFTLLAEFAERATGWRRLEYRGDEPARWIMSANAGLRWPLHAAALAAAELVASEDRRYVRVCPGSDCGWLFLDRRGRRRWCDMAACGNRAKARAFANRNRLAVIGQCRLSDSRNARFVPEFEYPVI